MNEPKHTPGPWSWEYSDKECTRHIALSSSPKDILLASEDADGPRAYIADADARLIAAAPDLLAACEFVRVWLISRIGSAAVESCLPELDAAIAKAKGITTAEGGAA